MFKLTGYTLYLQELRRQNSLLKAMQIKNGHYIQFTLNLQTAQSIAKLYIWLRKV